MKATRVIVASGASGHPVMGTIDQLIAFALVQSGADVRTFHCDSKLAACMRLKFEKGMYPTDIESGEWKNHTTACSSCANTLSWSKSLKNSKISNSNFELIHALPHSAFPGKHLNEQAFAGALRYFAVSKIENQDARVLPYFNIAAQQSEKAIRDLFDEFQPDVLVAHHGIYIPQGIYVKIAQELGIRVVTWNTGYRESTLLFSHFDTYHKTMIAEESSRWDQIELSKDQSRRLNRYLKSRQHGSGDWITFQQALTLKKRFARRKNKSTNFVLILTNVSWDARLHFRENIYSDMYAWLFDSISMLLAESDIEIHVRVHPAEKNGSMPSRDSVVHFLTENFPGNKRIKVYSPDNLVSSYDLASKARFVLVFGTKMAIELPAYGIPVITAGDAWTRGKNITFDPKSRNEYRDLIISSLENGLAMTKSMQSRARQYAYHVFFRRMIEIEELAAVSLNKKELRRRIETVLEKNSQLSTGLETIAKGIIHETPFEFPEK